jgi:predicted  nucleic acid-binding Zn-ribbon protein
MSDSQAYEEVTIGSDGVAVTKRFEEDEFPVPAIAFEFESNREESVRIRLADTVPEDIEVEDLGFHPEYGSEYWTIDDDTITFERELGANTSYTTVYGIRATGSDDIEQFLAEPTIEVVDPPLPDDADHSDVIPESGTNVVKDAIAGDGEIPGLEDEGEEPTEEDDDVTLDLKDPNEPETQQDSPAADPEPGEEAGSEPEPEDDETESVEDVEVTGDSLISAMAAEIRRNNVSAEDVKLLQQAFEIAAEEGGSTAAKIAQIQSDIADLRAYTSSLEEFLDENGTGQEMLEEFEQQVEQFDSQLADLESELQSNSGQLSSIDSEVDSIGERVNSVSNEVTSLSDDVSELDDEISSVDREVDGLGNEIDEMGEVISEFGSSIKGLEASVSEVEGRIDEVEEQVTDDDVAQKLESIEEDLNDLRQWQEQIKSTFGG